eukprot:3103194-Ditylum_brightwellii.AAC.1
MKGAGFYSLDRPTCLIKYFIMGGERSVEVDGTVLNHNEMQCHIQADAFQDVTSCRVYTSNNGVDYGQSFANFDIVQKPLIESTFPSSG